MGEDEVMTKQENCWIEIFHYRGHLALRIGADRYQMTRRGVRITHFTRWRQKYIERHPDERIQSIRLTVQPKERQRIEDYFRHVQSQNMRYSYLFRNCSQVVSRALRQADVVIALHPLVALQPELAFRAIVSQCGRCPPRNHAISASQRCSHGHDQGGTTRAAKQIVSDLRPGGTETIAPSR
jgi:hypothetical protein